jgi:hypothetical protein
MFHVYPCRGPGSFLSNSKLHQGHMMFDTLFSSQAADKLAHRFSLLGVIGCATTAAFF